MTEYLNPTQLKQFFHAAKKVLTNKGQLMTTIISQFGFGSLYITVAKRIRHIDKYNYAKNEVVNLLTQAGFTDISIVDLNSWLYVPWAYLVVAR